MSNKNHEESRFEFTLGIELVGTHIQAMWKCVDDAVG